MNKKRFIRVFVSSTFLDMKEEREILVKRVFPQLRKMCEERGVTWGEVDLRWGVTEEQKAEGKVLPICLEEIKHCRPYFIGFLGERYGWVPDAIPQELLDREPWLKEHLSHSVTELEILHGVLNNPDMAEHAFFYFRDPEYLKKLPKDTDQSDFISEDEASRIKLNDLKERIRNSRFPFHEDYPDPKALTELVLQDLTNVINTLYPSDEKIDPLDRDALDHEAFAQSRAQVYIGRDEYFDRLNKHVQPTDPPLVILGESGSGKSALLANWAIKYRKDHPDAFILMHFIGATSYSADWAAMIRRVMAELKRRFDIQQEIPDKTDELRSAFANWLHMASARGKAIIILDAVNQLEDREGALDLVWLPSFIPENIRLILSTLPGRPLEDLKERQWPTLAVQPLTQDEKKILIPFYLSQYTKALSSERVETIAYAPQTSNPLYLKVLLEELRIFGEHERLDERINHYLEAKDPYELYGKVLVRWEEDYEGDSDLVGDSMSLIWASRRGLTETELLELLGKGGSPLPRAQWSPLFLAAGESLVSRSGFLTFAHNFLREAVCDTYLPTEKGQHNAHLRLSDYFSRMDINPRMVDELPWQLSQAKAWHGLKDLLTQPHFFMAGWKTNQFDIMAYWAVLEDNSYRKVEVYAPLIAYPEKEDSDFVLFISALLEDSGHHDETLMLRAELTEKYRKSGDMNNYSDCLGMQANIHYKRGDLDEAMRLYKEEERISRALGNKRQLAYSLGGQANIHYVRGKFEEAMSLHKEEEGIYRELGNKDGLQASRGNQANIHIACGELDEAMRLHKETERICRELGNKGQLAHILGNQAIILQARGELDEAMSLLKEQERICRELGDKNGLSYSLCNQAVIHYKRGNLDEAMSLLKEQERICRELGNKEGLSYSLGNQAEIHYKRGNLDEAMSLRKEEERICRELGDKNELRSSLGMQANIHYKRGDLDEAMRLHKEKDRIYRELGNNRDLAASLMRQSILLSREGKYNDALKSIEESHKIATDCGFMDLIPSLNQLMDWISQKNSNSGESQTEKKPEISPTGKLICPKCKMECEKGTPFCKWCKASLK